MKETFPGLDLSSIPPHLQNVALTAQNLAQEGFRNRGQFPLAPRTLQREGGNWHAYWQQKANDDPKGYEELAIHVGVGSLMITHQHLHPEAGPSYPNGTSRPTRDFLRATAVFEHNKIKLFQTDSARQANHEIAPTQPTDADAFTRRIEHALVTLGLGDYALKYRRVRF